MTRVLIIEDSKVVGVLLSAIFESEPDLQVVGIASDGREGVRMAHALTPDVITMDIRMPVMDGFEATRLIMSADPVPIVVISSAVDDEELRITFRALEEGAVAVIEKPVGLSHPDFEAMRRELVETVRAMASVKVIRHWVPGKKSSVEATAADLFPAVRKPEIVAIGCSTGGPQALHMVLQSLPVNFAVPIVVTQHMSPGFIGGLATWLQEKLLLRVCLVQDQQALVGGVVYFAPDDYHLTVTRDARGLVARLSQEPPINGFRPSATPLLQSVAQSCGASAVGVLLTGMGSDGAAGLLDMRQAGAHTIVQDEASSIVFGMAGVAVALGAVDRIVELEQMGPYLQGLLARAPYLPEMRPTEPLQSHNGA